MAKTKGKKKVSVDWSDEDSVLRAMASALECEIEDLTIEEDKGMSSFRVGDIYRVEMGSKEYYVAENEEVAHDLAVAIVKQDLEESPENFEPNFIESHIDLKKLRDELQSDVESMRLDDLNEEAEKKPLKFMSDNDIEIEEPPAALVKKYLNDVDEQNRYEEVRAMDAEDQWSEIGEEPKVKDTDIEAIAESEAKAQLKDPLDYLKDIYGDDAVKKAIEIAGIDVDAAADEAVSTDGEGHFLSSYDGNTNDGPGKIVYWRHN
jgi:hypothetical protein